jgi:membrane-associated protease RseP (regulator of RpoE activity)
MIVWLILVGVFAYFMVRQSVGNLTRTPIWVLWLVMMAPALIWTAWAIAYGTEERIPPLLAIPPFIICPLLYIFLVQRGRSPKPSDSATPDPVGTEVKDVPQDPVTPQEALLLAQNSPTLKPPRLLDGTEERHLQDCFPWSVFYLRAVEYRPQAAICRGQLRTTPEVAYATVREKIQKQFSDRFLVVFQEGQNGKPFFALVPNPQAASQPSNMVTVAPLASMAQPGLVAMLLVGTLLTATWVGANMAQPDGALPKDFDFFLGGLPYAIALITILGLRELGRYVLARRHGIPATLPLFLPLPAFLGTLGAYTQLRTPVPNRRALFDIGFGGAIAGLVTAIPILLWGLTQSEVVPMSEGANLLNVEAITPRSSLLLAGLSQLALGHQWQPEQAIALHPVAIAGYIGFWLTAFHLIPLGSLDGGRIVHAMLGQRTGAIVGQVARLLVLALALVQGEFVFLALLLFFIPAIDRPTLNDVSQLDNRRDALGLLALTLLATMLLPVPGALLGLLG